MRINKKYILYSPLVLSSSILFTSCSFFSDKTPEYYFKFDDLNHIEDFYYDNNLLDIKKGYEKWYKSLSIKMWNRQLFSNPKNENNLKWGNLDAIVSSELQALQLYCIKWGHFWNESLHKQIEPVNTFEKFKDYRNIETGFLPNEWYKTDKSFEINGDGYKFIEQALNKETAIAPKDMRLYHGVEYQEVEFYEQLKPYIKEHNEYKGLLDFSDCVGKTITSYGFISTTTDCNINNFEIYSTGKNWTNNFVEEPPLKEPTIFVIDAKKDTKGLAWVSDPFDLMGEINNENQILINRNKSFTIKKWQKCRSGGKLINVFWMDLI